MSGNDFATAGSARSTGRNGVVGLDDLMMQDYIESRQERIDASQLRRNEECLEENVEREMLAFCKSQGGRYSMEVFLEQDCKIRYTHLDYEVLDDLGIEVIISIFCSKGEKFLQKPFKAALGDMQICLANQHKLFSAMCKLRDIASNGSVEAAVESSSSGAAPVEAATATSV